MVTVLKQRDLRAADPDARVLERPDEAPNPPHVFELPYLPLRNLLLGLFLVIKIFSLLFVILLVIVQAA